MPDGPNRPALIDRMPAAGGRGPLTPNGVYQAVARAWKRVGVAFYPHRFRHHFSHTWLDRGGAEGDLMELNGWGLPADAHPLRGHRPRRPRPPQLRPRHERRPLTPAARRRHTQETVRAGRCCPEVDPVLAPPAVPRAARPVRSRQPAATFSSKPTSPCRSSGTYSSSWTITCWRSARLPAWMPMTCIGQHLTDARFADVTTAAGRGSRRRPAVAGSAALVTDRTAVPGERDGDERRRQRHAAAGGELT
jgi:hypothetical protein